MSKKKKFEIDCNNIYNLNDFYNEIVKNLCAQFYGFGRNLDAFEDILRGGFGSFEFKEPIKIIFLNFKNLEGKRNNGKGINVEVIRDILKSAENVEFIEN